jgi:type II secretory pathway component PulF
MSDGALAIRRIWHRFLLVVPVIGPIRRGRATVRVAHALGALLASGVELPIALAHAARASGDVELEARLGDIRLRVLRGDPLSRALESSNPLGLYVTESVRTSEHGGELASVLAHAARVEAQRADETARDAARILEPVLFVTFASMAALVAVVLARG